jgi:hypothetical protein
VTGVWYGMVPLLPPVSVFCHWCNILNTCTCPGGTGLPACRTAAGVLAQGFPATPTYFVTPSQPGVSACLLVCSQITNKH